MHLGIPLVTAYAVVMDGGIAATWARADRASVSQERLGRLSSILVCGFRVHDLSDFHKSWVGYLCTCARADQSFCISGTAWQIEFNFGA